MQINDDSQPSGSKADNLMIVLKNNSFLIVLCVFTWIGYFVRTIPVGSISHIVYIAILMCVIHVVTLKFCHVHIRWFRGVVSVTGKFRHARAQTAIAVLRSISTCIACTVCFNHCSRGEYGISAEIQDLEKVPVYGRIASVPLNTEDVVGRRPLTKKQHSVFR